MYVLAAPADSNRSENAYNSILSEGLRSRGIDVLEYSLRRLLSHPPDVVHIHWPERFLYGHALRIISRVLLFDVALHLARWRRKTVLVWTIHNAVPHDGATSLVQRWFWRWFARRVDGYLTLSEAGAVIARSHHPILAQRPSWHTPHVDYRTILESLPTRPQARLALGLTDEAIIALCIGQVRRYKGAKRLVEAFARVAPQERSKVQLVIAGRPESDELHSELLALSERLPEVHLDMRLLPESDVRQYLAAADLVILPHVAVLNSGAALLALSAGRPVLAPALGALPELRRQVGDNWVHTFAAPLDTEDLAHAFDWVKLRSEEGLDLEAFSSAHISGLTERAYQEAREHRRSR